MKKGFRQMLAERQEEIKSLACIGLDPSPEKIPEAVKKSIKMISALNPNSIADQVYLWMREIAEATILSASMFKLQSAHWEAIPEGRSRMAKLIYQIHLWYPGVPVFLDCKRGDIDRTQARYREAHFGLDGADGINFSPYMGSSCMKNLISEKYAGRAIVGLCYTSNPEAREIQDVKLADGRRLWEFIAEKTLKWAEEFGVMKNSGLVMAAAYKDKHGQIVSDFLRKGREIVGDKLWYLIPGVGKQGGLVRETVLAAWAGFGSLAINSSSAISEASSGSDFKEAATAEAEKLAKESWAAAEEAMVMTV